MIQTVFDHRGFLQATGILGGTLVADDLPTLVAEAGTHTDMLCVQDCLPGSGPSKRAIVSISSSCCGRITG